MKTIIEGHMNEMMRMGDNDEKYEEDDFSISEVLPAPCDSDRIVGMCFQNVNVERVFLYYHYEFVKRDFG